MKDLLGSLIETRPNGGILGLEASKNGMKVGRSKDPFDEDSEFGITPPGREPSSKSRYGLTSFQVPGYRTKDPGP